MEWLPLSASNLFGAAEKQPRLWKHLILLIIIVVAVTVIYGNVTRAYFCAYDDFDNLHQTVFEDAYQPALIPITSHFNSYKYRPLHRLINLFTNFLADGDPAVFRIRNLVFHLLNAMLVYALGWLLFKSVSVSTAGALLFGLHPLANQSVIGAIWTNTVAHTGFLLALVMFIASTRAKRFWSLWLIGALISASLSLFTYDSEIVVFGLMCVYLVAHCFIRQERFIGWRFVFLFATLSGILLGSYFLLRRLFVPNGWIQVTANLPSTAVIGKNAAMYVLALLSPLDPVLADEWLGTPLPSEIVLDAFTVMTLVALALGFVLALAVFIWRWTKHHSLALRDTDWAAVMFLLCGIAAPLLPVLLFGSRPSETYVYLPVAFYSLLLSYTGARLLPAAWTPKSYAICASTVLLVVGLFSAGTWIRNERVVKCAETAHRILYGLPDKLVDGAWTVAFANIRGEKSTRRYGFYGFRGIDTIGHDQGADRAITHALQLVYRNKSLSGTVVNAEELSSMCSPKSASRKICVLVHWDGRIETCCLNSALAPVL